jgi:hypothetical protein
MIKGAKQTIKLIKATRANNKASRKNIEKIGTQLAQKNFKEKTGQEMTPSRLKAGMEVNNKESREYLKDKKNITKAKRKHYGL